MQISIKIHLDIIKIFDYDLEKKIRGMGNIKRIICYAQLKNQNNDGLLNFIFDTGAHTSLIPKDWWKDTEILYLKPEDC